MRNRKERGNLLRKKVKIEIKEMIQLRKDGDSRIQNLIK